jgi:hypothetical protein
VIQISGDAAFDHHALTRRHAGLRQNAEPHDAFGGIWQRSISMKQPNTEETVRHTDDQQNTGTHKKPGAPDEKGADRFGGSRAGSENVEPTRKER